LEITRREFVGLCGGAALLLLGINNYKSSALVQTITKGKSNDIKFITVGDPHVQAEMQDTNIILSDKGNARLSQVVDFVNKSDIDFVVFLGDMTDDGRAKSFELVKSILKNLNKPFYTIAGNHDLYKSNGMYEQYFGEMTRIEYFKGYQLLFIGIYRNGNDYTLKWNFDFDNADKNAPTLVFVHGPVIDMPIECIGCHIVSQQIIEYAKSMSKELDKFNNLIGVYSGHVHYDYQKVINGVRYVTVNGLINYRVGDLVAIPHSDKVGYSEIINDKFNYGLIPY
jgi:predicted phosphodiesterase